MLGKPRDQVLGKTDYELFPKEQADVFRRGDDSVFETGEADVSEERISDAQGNDRAIVTKKTLYVNKKGEKYVIGVMRDITERKRAEEALLESEVKYRTIVERSLVGAYIIQDGLYRFVNRRCCEIYGYAYDEMTDKVNPLDLTHPEDRKLVEENFRKRLSGEVDHIEYEMRAIRKDGKIIIVKVLGSFMTYKGRPAVSGTAIDITESRWAEEQLRQKTALLEAQVNVSLDGIVVVKKGRKILQNQQIIDLLKIPRHLAENDDDEAQVEWVRDLSKDPEHFYEKTAYMLAHRGETMRDELELKDGTVLDRYTRPVIGRDGKYYGRIWTFRDITERKRAEEALQDSEATLRSLINATREGLLLIDPEGKILVVNKTMAQRLGRSVRELVGTSLYEHFPPDVAARRKAEFDKVVRTGQSVHFLDERAERAYESYGYPVFNHGGRVAKVAIFAVDITERKKSEAALHASRLQLSEAMDLAHIIYWEFDPAAKAFVLNDPFYAFYGSTAEQEGGYFMTRQEYARRFIHPDDQPRFHQFVEQSTSRPGPESVSDIEHRIIRRDGEVRHILAWVRIVKDDSGLIVKRYGANQDITERKRAEEELQKAHRRLSGIIDFLPDATFVIDREKRVVAWNKAIEEMTGVKKEEILGKGDYAYAVPFYGEPRPIVIDLVLERNEEMEKTYDYAQREGGKLSMEVYVPKIYRGRGAYLSATASPLFDHEGNVVGAIETIRDTTEQKRIEKALQESEERYRTAIESSNDGIAIVKGRNHVFVNRKFLEIFGLQSPDEIVGQSASAIVHPDDRDRIREMNERRQRNEDVPNRYEFKGLRKNGEIVYIEASVTGTTYQGEPISLAFLRDVTERKSLEAQLLQAQKMEAIGTLAGGVAHDFNNILMVLMGYANLLQMKMGQNDPSRVYVDQILASTAKAANITQSLLAFGRKQVLEAKPHRISTIVKDVEKLLQRLMPEDIELVIKLGDDATVRADMTQIDQVLINLATNARDAMPKGGKLAIETGRFVIDEEFRRIHGYGKPDAYAFILVTDTGIGMDEKTQEKIFEPFFTTKEPGKGTGLGLSIVYGIIKQHNGYINVSSRPGEGSTFLLYLPEVEEKPRETRNTAREAKGGSETVLLAEDSADIRAVTSDILKTLGYAVIEAVNGRDAVEKFREHQNEINLIILDVVMPEKNGKEAYEEIRTMRHDVKALFMSGYTADVVFDKGIFGGTLDYIAKPIAPNELLHKVRKILDR
jgi:PAS domain S-box-containing protein